MDQDRWQRIESVFYAVERLHGDERKSLIARLCDGDGELRLEVESLLEELEREDDFLTEPAFAAGLALLASAERELSGGHMISHYRIIRTLGRGGMGEVYVAEDTRLKRPASLKLLPAHLTGDAGSVSRFRREALAASGVAHSGVAHVYDFGEAEGRHYLAMEYVEGAPLRELLKHESLSIAEALELAAQIADALAAAHEVGVVHRDVKPENIIVTEGGRAKVLDFGLAKLLEARHGDGGAPALLDSTPGLIMGTVAYMSPEQIRGEEVDARTDLWSLGVVLYEMVMRRRPFEGATHGDQIASILTTEPASLSNKVSARLDGVLQKALAKPRGERYQSAVEFARDLRRAARELEEEAASPDAADAKAPHPPARSVRRALSEAATDSVATQAFGRRGVWLTAAAALALTVIVVSFLIFRAKSGGGAGPTPSQVAPPAQSNIASLVILPLAIEGSDNDDLSFLAEGVAEDLIRSLGKIGKARVIALSSALKLKERAGDYAAIRRATRAEFLLEGSVTQVDGALKLDVYLVDLARGERIWEEKYESSSSELLYVRNALFVLLSNRLQAAFAGDKQLPLPLATTQNADAYRLYLRGRYAHERHSIKGLKLSIASLERAVALDPSFALAYSTLGDSYNLLGTFLGESPEVYLPKARAAINRSLALNDTLAPAHASLAKMKMDYDHDWAGAEREFKRAIEINPGYAQAHHWYGEVYLSAMGRLDESIKELQIAHELDPLSDGIITGLAWSYIGKHEYALAAQKCEEALALDSDDWSNYSYLAMAQLKLGRHEEAIKNAKTAYEHEKSNGNLANLGAIYGLAGRREEALKILRTLESSKRPASPSKYELATIYAALGERDRAFRLLNEEVASLSVDLLSIRIDPMLDTLRDDPRFPALEARYKFPPRP